VDRLARWSKCLKFEKLVVVLFSQLPVPKMIIRSVSISGCKDVYQIWEQSNLLASVCMHINLLAPSQFLVLFAGPKWTLEIYPIDRWVENPGHLVSISSISSVNGDSVLKKWDWHFCELSWIYRIFILSIVFQISFCWSFIDENICRDFWPHFYRL
jgi:hypothetical protein